MHGAWSEMSENSEDEGREEAQDAVQESGHGETTNNNNELTDTSAAPTAPAASVAASLPRNFSIPVSRVGSKRRKRSDDDDDKQHLHERLVEICHDTTTRKSGESANYAADDVNDYDVNDECKHPVAISECTNSRWSSNNWSSDTVPNSAMWHLWPVHKLQQQQQWHQLSMHQLTKIAMAPTDYTQAPRTAAMMAPASGNAPDPMTGSTNGRSTISSYSGANGLS